MGKLQQSRYTTDLSSPEHVLPSQFACKNRQQEPERMLWLDVLGDAARIIQTFDGNDPAEVEQRDSEIAWFRSDEVFIGSFRWICDVLGLDPDYMRKMALRGVP